MFRKPRRKIVYHDFVQQAILDRIDEYPRLYELMKFFEWLLERQPNNAFAEQLEPPIDDFWLIKSDDVPLVQVPSVRLIYCFDDETVTFWGIHID